MATVQQAFALALQHHQAGRLSEAEAIYRQILARQPDHGAAMHYLGVIAFQAGRHDHALHWIQQAISLNPNDSAAHANLGEVYRGLGRLHEAIAAYRRALELDPGNPAAHSNLGEAYRLIGRPEEALAACRRALELQPDSAEAHNNLGNALRDQRTLAEAAAAYRAALKINPDYPAAQNNLGVVLAEMGQLHEAIAAYRRALELKADYPEAHNNLGNAWRGLGRLDEAILAYHRALGLKPDYPEALNNLGNALGDSGQLDEAIAACRRALQLRPEYVDASNNLGNALKDQAALDEAIAAYRRALQVQPDCAAARSNLIYALHFKSDQDAGALAEEHQCWNRQFSEPLKQFIQPHTNDRNPERRLRIGYVSPEFRDHVTGRYLLPLFEFHDHASFEIVCYSGVIEADETTRKFRHLADRWRSTVGVPDEALARLVRDDAVDILVDLTQHLEGNRLTMFARQPAPVQVSFAGCPESTGVEAIEYRISDRWLELGLESLPGRERSPSVPSNLVANEEDGERSASLPYPDRKERVFLIGSFWCYDPCGIAVKVDALPAEKSGRVTFGSLNNFCKTNEPLLRLWARVLREIAEARLVLLSGFGSHRQRTRQFLEREGVASDRVEFVERCSRREYLELYQRLDIVLDTFPCNGHTTSLDALWMGVPVVSLAGKTRMSRAGLSVLSNLDLPEWVAHSEDQYVAIAAALARDIPRLSELRRTLRARMEASVLMNKPRFAHNIEAAYRAMWRRWCAKGIS